VGGYPEPGNVINIASMSGVTTTSQRGQFNYNSGKWVAANLDQKHTGGNADAPTGRLNRAATISLSLQLATEFARRGLNIRVNVVNPGYFPSSMTVIDPSENQSTEEHERKFREDWGIPFGRPGGPEDYAQCIFGLAVVSAGRSNQSRR
jgi:NAD(P)-dependent dehydrogenase (short-subunit alcohol dehydrogenase family)